MKKYNSYSIWSNTSDPAKVDLRNNTQSTSVPNCVEFTLSNGEMFRMEVRFVQLFRRAIYTAYNGENKIRLIQGIRALTGLGLRDAKGIAEYFIDNFEIEVGINQFNQP